MQSFHTAHLTKAQLFSWHCCIRISLPAAVCDESLFRAVQQLGVQPDLSCPLGARSA